MMAELCLGTVQFGTNYGIQGNGKPREEEVFDILLYAVDHHIEMFDTASVYGKAEALLGEFIKKYPEPACKMKIVSKLRADALNKIPVDKWTTVIKQNAVQSLKQMGINCFEAYLFHDSSQIFNSDAVRALSGLKQEGLSKAVGVSVYTPEEAMRALEYDEIDVIQVPYNVFDHRLDKCGFFIKAEERGVKVYARSVLLQGLVVMNPDNLPPTVSMAGDYLSRFDELCNEYNVSRYEAAFRYVLTKQGISCIVYGVDNITQLTDYVELRKMNMSEEMIKQIDETFYDVPERLVNPVLWNQVGKQ